MSDDKQRFTESTRKYGADKYFMSPFTPHMTTTAKGVAAGTDAALGHRLDTLIDASTAQTQLLQEISNKLNR